ncbi:MAG: ImmA/IrrE family metallo-endopeptidase [Phycisphaerae bacterium]
MSGRQFDRGIRRRYRKRFGEGLDVPAGPDRLTQARRDEIAELAEAVAGEHCPTGPVEPGQIARTRRITISFGPYGDAFDGMLEHRWGRFHIFCNLGRVGRPQAPRARFTLAHELGHYYIDEHRCALASGRCPAHRSVCDYESANLAEQEADHFAANLLMPRPRFLVAARAATPGLAGIVSLAETFAASLTSTAIRYAACDAAACAVVKWTSGCYAWKWLSSATFQARFRRTVEAPQQLAAGSPTARAVAGERPEGDFFEAGTTASAWFPGVKSGEYRDVILIEQAVPLGRYGVLTFLRPESGRYRFDG